jgi:ribosome-binding ATPase YchF (GTP1/OBG family)
MHEQDARLYQEIDRRNYDLLQAAVQFSNNHKALTSNQASGLLNVVNCEDNLNTIIREFIQHQADKADKADKKAEQKISFWKDLLREVEGLRKQADEIRQNLGLKAETQKAQKEQLAKILLLLVRDYVQHLVAHNIYRQALEGGKNNHVVA